jgi:hypothetical protein
VNGPGTSDAAANCFADFARNEPFSKKKFKYLSGRVLTPFREWAPKKLIQKVVERIRENEGRKGKQKAEGRRQKAERQK